MIDAETTQEYVEKLLLIELKQAVKRVGFLEAELELSFVNYEDKIARLEKQILRLEDKIEVLRKRGPH